MQSKANELCHGRNVLHHLLPSVLKLNLDFQEWRQCAAFGVTMWKEQGLLISICGKWDIEKVCVKGKDQGLWSFSGLT